MDIRVSGHQLETGDALRTQNEQIDSFRTQLAQIVQRTDATRGDDRRREMLRERNRGVDIDAAAVQFLQRIAHRFLARVPLRAGHLHGERTAGAELERFTREAQTAARLSHPHIVPIHTVGEGRGLVYFVMGYVDGESVGGRLKRRATTRPPTSWRSRKPATPGARFATWKPGTRGCRKAGI